MRLVLAVGGRWWIVVLAVAATLLTLWLLLGAVRSSGGIFVRPRRTRDRRERHDGMRANPGEALALVGDALAATHNPRALLPVILEVVVEATGARGGRVREGNEEVSWLGDVDAGDPSIVLELARDDDGGTTLSLYAPEGGFTAETQRTAEWLASQAAIALENAKLHHLVQRQATTDDLTGLVNRRRFIEALESEIVRASTFASPLSVVLGDLDHFKLVNDRFGHPAGDHPARTGQQPGQPGAAGARAAAGGRCRRDPGAPASDRDERPARRAGCGPDPGRGVAADPRPASRA